jgi:predicted dehydrogenase
MTRISEHPAAVLAAVAGRDQDRATDVAARHAVPGVYKGFAELVRSGAIDAVVVVAPDELHEAIALVAFDAGIHVLCEKPLASSPGEARRMADAAEASGLVNMSYFGLRTSPLHRYLHSLVSNGMIGSVRMASFTLEHGLFRSAGYNWRFDSSHGGGVIADLGCYLFDLARWYVGDVDAVSAHGATHVRRPHPDGREYAPADDSCVGAIGFTGGAHATFAASVVAHTGPGFQKNTVQLQGERGRLELTHTFAGASLRCITDGQDDFKELPLPAGFAAPSGDAEFIDAILAGSRVRPDFTDGWRVQQCVAAAASAARSGVWVNVESGQQA